MNNFFGRVFLYFHISIQEIFMERLIQAYSRLIQILFRLIQVHSGLIQVCSGLIKGLFRAYSGSQGLFRVLQAYLSLNEACMIDCLT